MSELLHLEVTYLKRIFESIQDGIIIMDQQRHIIMMNPSAEHLTGWKLNGTVPLCTYCENRNIQPGENTCYLLQNDEVPYFLSKMPTYHGEKIDVEMSTALVYHDRKSSRKEYLLVLRDQSAKKREEEARISKLMIKKLIDAKESEHKRLAKELHDGVGQSLFSISVALQAIESYINDARLNTYIGEVRKELEKVMNDVKDYSQQLRPHSLDQLGIVAAIHTLIASVERNNAKLSISFVTNVEERCQSPVEINLYRVIQEALHNTLKYAQASKISIRLFRTEAGLTLTINDNGKGFNPDELGNPGLGLKHMDERVDQLGGTFELESIPTKGTNIKIFIPQWMEDQHD
ncbi:PAS domain-containing sensor histidine kinase [Peribacillus sp. NPDC006672]|uniref:PAS domain-containing sensor histidine kinase n=1 Tax=Peribacillus sp. NPDC006672 TaxID=3390606 RepID=UPI003CFD42E9